MIKSCYIHIPFCKSICSYCDFCKMYYNSSFINKYLKALEKEINETYNDDVLNTLYVGGGTPSCLDKKSLKELFLILNKFKLNEKYEFTFECNIEDINEEFAQTLKENRVNRLSIGIQSFNKKYLNLMNRRKIGNIKDKINLCKKYFSNINVDLMYGFNDQTIDELKADLEHFLELDVSHISTYSLILENNTKLKIDNYQELDDDVQRNMYDLIRKTLKDKGYIHYEFSNFSKKGFESQHNLTYWNNECYYGFGLGASGYINNVRYDNTRNLNKYLAGNYMLEKNILTLKEDMENYMILGLRKIKGVSKKEFYNKYNINIEDVFDVSMLGNNKNYYYIKTKDLYISNSILINFIDVEE